LRSWKAGAVEENKGLPCGTDEGQEVRHVWDCQTQVRLWANLPLVCQIDAAFANDGEARAIRDVKASCANNGVYLSLYAISTNDTFLRTALDRREMDIYVVLLNSLHIRITRCDPSTADTKVGSEAFEETLVLDELLHTLTEEILSTLLCLTAVVEGSP